jgi:transposase
MDMIERMKQEIAKTQNIIYPEQIRVAKIYYLVANALAKACRKSCGKQKHCKAPSSLKRVKITLDAFILLKQLRDENLISEAYAKKIFNSLLKLKPELKERVSKDSFLRL